MEDLPEDFREVAERYGMAVALDMVQWAGGSQLTVPSAKTVTRPARDRQIEEDFKACLDYGRVARKHDLSESHVRAILRVRRGRRRRQMGLFGEL